MTLRAAAVHLFFQRNASRCISAVATLALNALLLSLLATPSMRAGGYPAETPITLFALRDDSAPVLQTASHAIRKRRGPHGPPVPPGAVNTPQVNGPPTETVASITLLPDLEAHVIGEQSLRADCRHAYPVELNTEEAQGAEVTLRLYVTDDGRIGQGTITKSSGDADLDLLILKCLQAYGHFEPAVDDDQPIGSWQLLTWR